MYMYMYMTSGELSLDASQKQVLLDFVRNSKSFIGVHSAKASLATDPEVLADLLGEPRTEY